MTIKKVPNLLCSLSDIVKLCLGTTMTITIEREALLSIANTNNNTSPQCPKDAGDIILDNHSSKECVSWRPVSLEHSEEYLPYRVSSCPIPDLDDTDDDSSCYSCDNERRVSFASPLVTEVRTRPRTRQSDLKCLFYSYEDTQR